MNIKNDKEQEDKLKKHIEETTKLLSDSQKQLDKEMKIADKCFSSLADLASPEDKSKVLAATRDAKLLINKIKQGGDKENLIQQIKNLANKYQ